jgi:hypothetical protein
MFESKLLASRYLLRILRPGLNQGALIQYGGETLSTNWELFEVKSCY